MKLPAFDCRCPSTPSKAIDILAANPGAARPLAGGQTLVEAALEARAAYRRQR